jgi:hypothetical protein
VTDSAPSPVAAGGGVFIAHVGLNRLFDQLWFVVVWSADQRPLKSVESSENEEPCLLCGEQGSRKPLIYGIVNYLFASLVRSLFAFSSLVTLTKGGQLPAKLGQMPERRIIPAQRNQAVACEACGYVLMDFIGDESNPQYVGKFLIVNHKIEKSFRFVHKN